MQEQAGSLERLGVFIEKQRKLADEDGDIRRSTSNSINATANVLFEQGYFDTEEMPPDGRSPQLSQAIDGRIARLNSADALDALERIEAHAAEAARAAAHIEKLVYRFAGPLVVALGFLLWKVA